MILLRHGQSEFNLLLAATRRDPGLADPRLTEYGHHQAEEAARQLAGERITRIVVSPYTRALQTAEPVARRLGLRPVIDPLVRERYGLACDIGTHRDRLSVSWLEHDFAHLDGQWWPEVHESPAEVADRARAFRQRMAVTPEWETTLVVSHWGFILCMTGENVPNGAIRRCDPTGPLPEQTVWRH